MTKNGEMTKIPKELKGDKWFQSIVYNRLVSIWPIDYIVQLESIPSGFEDTSDWYNILIYMVTKKGNRKVELYDDAVSWSDALDKFNTWYKRIKEDTK